MRICQVKYDLIIEPKVKNNLNIQSVDIELALRILNKEWTPDTRLQP